MKLVIHVGYPKTGSTTLQYGLFKYLHDVGQIHLKCGDKIFQMNH